MKKARLFSNDAKLAVFMFILVCMTSLSSSLNAPIITSVSQLNETTLNIKWRLENASQTVSRYRLFYRNDYSNDGLNEWPAQIMKRNYMVKNQPYFPYNSSSTFDCFNECIKNSRCLYVLFKNNIDNLFNLNCILKLNRTINDLIELKQIQNLIKSVEYNNLAFNDDKEFALISEYSNEVNLFNVPTMRNYKFYVTVYDPSVEKWSPLSESSNSLNIKINILLDFEQINNKGMIIKWQQYGTFRDYVISRYTIHIYNSKSNHLVKSIPLLLKVGKYKLDPDYVELKNELLEKNVNDENQCLSKCLKMSNCVRFAYYKLYKDCYLHTSLNLSKSYYKSVNMVAYSIKSEAKKCLLTSLVPYKEYFVQLEYLTMYGDIGFSNKIKLVRKELTEIEEQKDSDLDELVLENEYDDEIITYKEEDIINSSTLKTSTKPNETDYDNNDKFIDFELEYGDNFETTISSIDAEDDDYDDKKREEENEKIKAENVKESNKNTTSIMIEQTDQARLEISIKIGKNLVSDGEAINLSVNDSLEINCELFGGEKILARSVWKKIDEEENAIALYDKFVKNEIMKGSVVLRLTLDKVSKTDRGKYECSVEDFDERSTHFNLFVNDVPSQPKIESILLGTYYTLIRWNIMDLGDSDLKYASVEWSNDFDKDLNVNQKNVDLKSERIKNKETNVIRLDETLPANNQVRFRVFNEKGSSLYSNLFVCGEKSCQEMRANVVNSAEDTLLLTAAPKRKNDQETKLNKTKSILIVTIVCVLIVIIIVYIIYDSRSTRRQANGNSQKRASSSNKSYNPLPTSSS